MTVLIEQSRTVGDDSLYGFSVEDTLDGGAGNDLLSGGNENDTYVFAIGYGQDTILDDMTNLLSGQDDRVIFKAGIAPGGVTLSRDGFGSLDLAAARRLASTGVPARQEALRPSRTVAPGLALAA